jgi:hypothetical protein
VHELKSPVAVASVRWWRLIVDTKIFIVLGVLGWYIFLHSSVSRLAGSDRWGSWQYWQAWQRRNGGFKNVSSGQNYSAWRKSIKHELLSTKIRPWTPTSHFIVAAQTKAVRRLVRPLIPDEKMQRLGASPKPRAVPRNLQTVTVR